MPKTFDPVEKVVETLFFYAVFTALPDRGFCYAPLSGTSEKMFGDAFALSKSLLVFEFKRSLNSVARELEKFKKSPVKFERDFAKVIESYEERLGSLQSPEVARRSCHLHNTTGHYLVVLQTNAQQHQDNCLVVPRSLGGRNDAGCKLPAAVHFSPISWQISRYLPAKSSKTVLAGASFRVGAFRRPGS